MAAKRFFVIGLFGLSLLGLAGAKAATPDFPNSIFVTVQGANAVEELPSGRMFDGLTGAHYDAVSNDGKTLVAGSFTTGDVFIVDVKSGKKLATLSVGNATQGVNISPNGEWAMAVAPNGGTVTAINLKTLKIAKTIAVGKVPHNVGFSPHGRLAYVTLQGGTGVAVIDMKSLTKIKEIPVPGIIGPHNLDFSDHGAVMWVRDILGRVALVDLKTDKELAVIAVGRGHAGIDVVPGGRYVFTGAIADNVVDVIDRRTMKVVKRIAVGEGPHGVRASTDGRFVYADVTQTNKVAVIDTRTLKIIKQIPTKGSNPFWVAVPGHD